MNQAEPECSVEWISKDTYAQLLQSVHFLPLLQSPAYYEATADKNAHAYFGTIYIDQHIAGLFMVSGKNFANGLIKHNCIDMGPLWFNGYATEANMKAFLSKLHKALPKSPFKKRRIMPQGFGEMLTTHKKFKKIGSGYETIVIDLTQSQIALMAALKKNWRGALKKAQKSDIDIQWSYGTDNLNWLLKTYELDKIKRDYTGPDVKTLRQFENHAMIGRAMIEGKCEGAVMFVTHAPSATYQIGWASDIGRKNNTTHILLWRGMLELKKKGYTTLDLGGIGEENDTDKKGLTNFKKGIGGTHITYSGIYS